MCITGTQFLYVHKGCYATCTLATLKTSPTTQSSTATSCMSCYVACMFRLSRRPRCCPGGHGWEGRSQTRPMRKAVSTNRFPNDTDAFGVGKKDHE